MYERVVIVLADVVACVEAGACCCRAYFVPCMDVELSSYIGTVEVYIMLRVYYWVVCVVFLIGVKEPREKSHGGIISMWYR